MTEMEADVAVVGGGLAGLTAAYRLREDADVVVLEAEHRTGGRTMSGTWEGYGYNLGAQIVGNPQSPVEKLARELNVSLVEAPLSGYSMYIKGKLVTAQSLYRLGLKLPLSLPAKLSLYFTHRRLNRLRRQIFEPALPPEEYRRFRRELDARSYGEILGHIHPDAWKIFANQVAGLTNMQPPDLSGFLGLVYTATNEGPVSDETPDWQRVLIVEKGTEEIANALATALGGRVHRGRPVRRATQRDGSVLIEAEGLTVRAKRAIVATPAFVTREIVAGLSAEKQRALEEVPYSALLSVVLLTNEREPMPWDTISGINVYDKWFLYLSNVAYPQRQRSTQRQRGGALYAMAVADKALGLAAMSDEEITRLVLADVADIFPQVRHVFAESVVQRWERGLPHWPPGRLSVQPLLRQPEGLLHFAGDYTDYANLQGAVKSGERAAREVREALGLAAAATTA